MCVLSFSFKAKDNNKTDEIDYSGKRKMDNTNPMFSILYKASPLTSMYSLYSTAFQTPTTTELSNQPYGAGGFNQELMPEQIQNYEIGFKRIDPGNKIRFSFAGYIINISNF